MILIPTLEDVSTVNGYELIWTISMGIAFLALLISAGIVLNKYRLYRKPDAKGVRGNGVGKWLFWKDTLLYALLLLVTGVFTWVGIRAMQTPEPVRSANQSTANVAALIFIGVAVGTAAYALVNLWLGFKIDREIRDEGSRQDDIHKRDMLRWRRRK